MTTLRTPLLVTALLVGLVTAGGSMASASEGSEHLTLSNDAIVVTFHDARPNLTVARVDGSAEGALAYRFTDLVEYRDLNGNGAPDAGEIVARLDLQKSAWTATSASEGGVATLALNLTAPVKLGAATALPTEAPALPLPPQVANITLVFTLREAEGLLDVNGVNVTVPATTFTYELVVASWPFVNADVDRLALLTSVAGEVTLDEAPGLEGGQVSFNGTKLGALAWSPIAIGNTTEGKTIDVPVKANATPKNETTTLSFTYDAAQLASLTHAATAGVVPTDSPLQGTATSAAPGLKDVPGPGVLFALAVVGAAALAMRRW